MAWFNWFSDKNNLSSVPAKGARANSHSSERLGNAGTTLGGQATGAAAQPASTPSPQRLERRRKERNNRRESLFQVVRESMVRVGVLSSAFKFKVLSLDQRGRSFLVMIELSAEFSGEVEKLAEIERMIAQTARHRYEIMVKAVYWRYFNAATATAHANATTPLLGATQAPISRPAPLFSMDGTAPKASANPSNAFDATLPITKSNVTVSPNITGSFPIIGATASQKAAAAQPARELKLSGDDLGEDEVAAFRRALAMGNAQGVIAAAATEPNTLEKARTKLLLTGYEDTEMADDDPMPALSGTQYGEMR